MCEVVDSLIVAACTTLSAMEKTKQNKNLHRKGVSVGLFRLLLHNESVLTDFEMTYRNIY